MPPVVRVSLTRAETRRELRHQRTRREKQINTVKWIGVAILAVIVVASLVATGDLNAYGM